MSGTVINNLGRRKFAVLVTILLLCQLMCFLIGGLMVPNSTDSQSILATVCEDNLTVKNDTMKWFFSRDQGFCKFVDLENWFSNTSETDIVFAFQIPVARENKILEYTRWQQRLLGLLQIDIAYQSEMKMNLPIYVNIDARLAYRNKGDPIDDWKLYTQSIEKRHLDCDITIETEDNFYNCSDIPLFELGSLFHDYYLLNVRLSVDTPGTDNNLLQTQNLWLTVINQNEKFTKVWVSMKTIFFPCIIGILVWYGIRIYKLERKPVLLEKMLLSLGIGILILDIPLEYLTLYFNLKFMLLMGDIRQGMFYVKLFSFWLVFAGEHMLVRDATQSSLKHYWVHISTIAIGGILLFVLNMLKKGIQFRNPFYSVWFTDMGTSLVLPFIIVAGISIGVYYLYLCYSVFKVFKYITHERQSLSTMSEKRTVRYLHYEGVVYRFKILMLATLVCAALTIIGILLGQLTDGQWKWNEYIELEYTSAFFTGVYGMWNIYIFALLCLYAPSNKTQIISKSYLNRNISRNKDNESLTLND